MGASVQPDPATAGPRVAAHNRSVQGQGPLREHPAADVRRGVSLEQEGVQVRLASFPHRNTTTPPGAVADRRDPRHRRERGPQREAAPIVRAVPFEDEALQRGVGVLDEDPSAVLGHPVGHREALQDRSGPLGVVQSDHRPRARPVEHREQRPRRAEQVQIPAPEAQRADVGARGHAEHVARRRGVDGGLDRRARRHDRGAGDRAVVDRAVAVVVEAVEQLGCVGAALRVGVVAVAAADHPAVAVSVHLLRGHGPVAVVVGAVAALGGTGVGVDVPVLAVALAGEPAVAVVVDLDALVHQPVAVVVLQIALLRRSGQRQGLGVVAVAVAGRDPVAVRVPGRQDRIGVVAVPLAGKPAVAVVIELQRVRDAVAVVAVAGRVAVPGRRRGVQVIAVVVGRAGDQIGAAGGDAVSVRVEGVRARQRVVAVAAGQVAIAVGVHLVRLRGAGAVVVQPVAQLRGAGQGHRQRVVAVVVARARDAVGAAGRDAVPILIQLLDRRVEVVAVAVAGRAAVAVHVGQVEGRVRVVAVEQQRLPRLPRHIEPGPAVSVRVHAVDPVAVGVDPVKRRIRRPRVDRGVTVVAVEQRIPGGQVPPEAVPVHVRQIRAVAVLVDAVVGRLRRAGEGVGVAVVALGAGQEPVPVGVGLVGVRPAVAVLIDTAAQLLGLRPNRGVLVVAAPGARHLSIAVLVLLVQGERRRAVVVHRVAELRVAEEPPRIGVVAVAEAGPLPVAVLICAVLLEEAAGVGVVAVGAAAQGVGAQDAIAVGVAERHLSVAVLVELVVGDLGCARVDVPIGVVAVGAARSRGRKAVPVGVDARDPVAVVVDAVGELVVRARKDRWILRITVLGVLRAVAVEVEPSIDVSAADEAQDEREREDPPHARSMPQRRGTT